MPNKPYEKLKDMPMYQALEKRNSEYASKLDRLFAAAEICLKEIPNGLFDGFTDHSIAHSLKIITYMHELMRIDTIDAADRFSSRDLYYAIATALLHDTGMVISQTDINAYLDGTKEDENFNINQILALKEFKTSKEKNKVKLDLLSAYIRKNHGKRSHQRILNKESDFYAIIADDNDRRNIAQICESHCMSIDAAIASFKSLKEPLQQLGSHNVGSCLYNALILRIADALDISDKRVSNFARKNRAIDSRADSKSHWDMNDAIRDVLLVEGKDYLDAPNESSLNVHVSIKDFETYKADENRTISDETILKASYYEILSDVTQYFLMVQKELLDAKRHSINIAYYNKKSNNYEQYFIDISTRIKYDPEQEYESHKIDINYKTVLANLLGNGLYGDRRVGLREIVQNSIDAIKWKNASLQNSSNSFIEEQNKIIITIDANKDFVSIADNGIGMDKNTITDCMLGIGKSIYSTEKYRIDNSQFQHIGYYGIGFFSVFMLCDSVTINSRKTGEPITSITINDTNRNYFSKTIETPDRESFFYNNTSGTEIVLHGINKFKEAFSYLQKKDQPDTSEQCYGEAVQHYLELLFLNDNQCKIKFIINETLDHEPNCKIDEICEGKFTQECKIPLLDANDKHYSKKESIAETLIKYTGNSYDAIFQWDGSKFVKITDWGKLQIDDGKPIEICTITDWNTGKLILLYVPLDNMDHPFELGVTNYRQRVFYKEQPLIGSYTLDQFMTDTGANPIIRDKNYCIAIIEKMYLQRILNTAVLYKRNAYFEEVAPLSAIKSGREYLDKLYIRNVLVPKSHLCLPIMIVGYNGKFTDEIEGIYINILSRNVVPNIKRDDLDDANLKTTSQMIAELLIKNSNLFDNIKDNEKEYILKTLTEDIK